MERRIGSLLSTVALGTVGAGLIVWLAAQLSVDAVMASFTDLEWWCVGILLMCGMATTACRVLRYGLFYPVLRRWFDVYGVFVYVRALNYVLPFRLGEPVALLWLKRWDLAPSVSGLVPVWTLFRLTDFVAVFVVLVVSNVIPLSGRLDAAGSAWLLPISIIVCAASVLCAAFWRQLASLASYRLASYKGQLAIIMSNVRLGIELIGTRRAAAGSLAMSLFIAGLNIAASLCALWAISVPVAATTGVGIGAIALVLSAIPLRPPLGLGLNESIWTGLLVLAGVAPDQAFAGALAVRAAQIAIIVLEVSIVSIFAFRLNRGGSGAPGSISAPHFSWWNMVRRSGAGRIRRHPTALPPC
jgi:uncharacterized membrane protein YbhN (UPF0104 family)